MSDREQLQGLAARILDPEKQLADLIPAAAELRDLFEQRTGFTIDPDRDIAAGQTRLESGLAISPVLAAMCIRELFRTLAFIRGLAAAIEDAAIADRPARVLYAGCGPYALLALPLMALFPREKVAFTLLDIHPQCLDSAQALIDSFGLRQSVAECICADATCYRIPEDKKPDVIVSETMAVCLHNEPQVTIARRLHSQAPEAILVPQAVSVEACLLNYAREHVFMPADYTGEFPLPQRDRVNLGKIFELNAGSICSWENIDGDRLPAGRVNIPESFESRYQPHLLTHIVVYGKNELHDYDCSLTIPQRLRGKIEGGEKLQFHYQLGNNPELRYEFVS